MVKKTAKNNVESGNFKKDLEILYEAFKDYEICNNKEEFCAKYDAYIKFANPKGDKSKQSHWAISGERNNIFPQIVIPENIKSKNTRRFFVLTPRFTVYKKNIEYIDPQCGGITFDDNTRSNELVVSYNDCGQSRQKNPQIEIKTTGITEKDIFDGLNKIAIDQFLFFFKHSNKFEYDILVLKKEDETKISGLNDYGFKNYNRGEIGTKVNLDVENRKAEYKKWLNTSWVEQKDNDITTAGKYFRHNEAIINIILDKENKKALSDKESYSDIVKFVKENCQDTNTLFNITSIDFCEKLKTFVSDNENVKVINNYAQKGKTEKDLNGGREYSSAIQTYIDFLKRPIPSDRNLSRNLIYFGAPGTGKSYTLNNQKNGLLLECPSNYERVTFHPDYSYANFVGSYRPVEVDEDGTKKITYKFVPGPFIRVLKKALNNEQPYLLIIEEINRANPAAVFGDVFQLLDRDSDGNSEYSISPSKEVKEYLMSDEDCKGLPEAYVNELRIPSNMFIWATMNSADQGVYPMDTAFKRRWDFEYIGIDNGKEKIENAQIKNNGEEKTYNWNQFREKLNEKLVELDVNEDKLIGPFFIKQVIGRETIDDKGELEKLNSTIKSKLIMYLFEDVARQKSVRKELFKGVKAEKNITLSTLFEEYDKMGINVFDLKIVKTDARKKDDADSVNKDDESKKDDTDSVNDDDKDEETETEETESEGTEAEQAGQEDQGENL